MSTDYLYHLGIQITKTNGNGDVQIQKKFGDVKFFLLGGTRGRMLSLAKYIRNLMGFGREEDDLEDLCKAADRYSMFKVGPVVCCSHGIGMATFSVLLHELMKLAKYAKCIDPIFIRIGTSGGLGVLPGTVVVTQNAYNGYMRNEHEIAILGQRVVRPAQFNEELLAGLLECRQPDDEFQIIKGNTLATDCFYEGQGRLDGALCAYTEVDKLNFLRTCYQQHSIKNIEMEATMFSSLTKELGVKAADVCVTLLNRLDGDQILITHEQKKDYEMRPFIVVGRYIQKSLSQK